MDIKDKPEAGLKPFSQVRESNGEPEDQPSEKLIIKYLLKRDKSRMRLREFGNQIK